MHPRAERHRWIILGLAGAVLWPAVGFGEEVSLSATSATRAVAASAPVLEKPADMRVHAGATADQVIHATDVDGDPLTFFYNAGPNYMSVTTTDPGTGSATGNIHLAPSFHEAGTETGIVGIYDGVNFRTASFGISVAPLLQRVADMTVSEGETADQVLATSGDVTPLTVSLQDGPPFASVAVTSDTTIQIHVAPGFTDSGIHSASLYVSDGVASLTFPFRITVNNTNRDPVLAQPRDMHATAGAITEQVLTASDPDGQFLSFLVVSGSYVTTRTLSLAPSVGAVDVSPPAGIDESIVATVAAADGISRSDRSFTVRIDGENQGPVIHADPILTDEGTELRVAIIVTDTDGQRLVPTLSNLPAFMTAGLSFQNPGNDTLTIPLRLLPNYTHAGVYHPVLTVSDRVTSTTDTLDITVREVGVGETSLHIGRDFGGFANEREYSTQDGTFDATGVTVAFQSNTGSGANWTLRSVDPWAEGIYVRGDRSGFQLTGVDTTGVDLAICDYTPQTVQVRRVRYLGKQLVSLWVTFYMFCEGGTFTGDFRYNVPGVPISLTAPHWLPANTNRQLFFQVSAEDTAKDAITISASGLPVGATFVDVGGGVGTLFWTPAHLQSGDFHVRFVATSAGGLTDTALTTIHVTSDDLPPVAYCGGPYTATVGVPVPFSSAGTTDPDGDTLSYHWFFGDGATDWGPAPYHAYSRTGFYSVQLVVSDGLLSAGDVTLATVGESGNSQAFQVKASSSGPIQLLAGGLRFRIGIEIPDAPSRVADIDPLSLRLVAKGLGTTEAIAADPSSFSLGDANRNGLPDVTAWFGSESLRPLFSKVSGTLHVTATVEFAMRNGTGFKAPLSLDVTGPDGTLRPVLAPNPFRASGVFSFATTVPGNARLTMFDSSGRRVRTILDVSSLPTGYHDLPIDTHDDAGRTLPAGTYFYKLETSEGIRSGRLTLIR